MFANTIIIDFETTGLNPYHDDIIEIAAKVFGKDLSFSKLIKTTKTLEKKIVDITGITNNMLDAEGFERKEVYTEFGRFIVDACSWHNDSIEPIWILAHNGNSFDFIFFKQILKTLDYRPDFRFVDTISVSKYVNPRLYSHRLATLCHPKIYNVTNDTAHRALSDVITTEKIFQKMIYHKFSSIEEVYNKIEFID